ncbi:MAG: putative tellurium resistance membrane protein TerC [Verrucomicrobiales bacterium]|jgi:predicted tellurium resistance membrane protein TerC
MFDPSILVTLLLLVMLQAVLGFDNLLYISLESKRAPESDQKRVRKLGIMIAVGLRIVLLLLLTSVISAFTKPFFKIPDNGVVTGDFNVESVIILLGGAFIIYTAVKEIFHMLAAPNLGYGEKKAAKPAGQVIFLIVMMNVVFSFDSILSAMALAQKPILDAAGEPTGQTEYIRWVMIVAILIGGALMIVLADTVSTFLEKNRMYEVLGLFVLFIVGIMLLSEGGHKAHLHFFGNPIHAMSKTTFYFVIGVLVIVDLVQGRYQRKLLAQKAAASAGHS